MGEQFVKGLLVWRACQQAMTTASSQSSTEVELDLRGMSPVHMLLRRHGSGTSFPDSEPTESRDEDLLDLDEEDEEEDDFDLGNVSSGDLGEDEESDSIFLNMDDGNDEDDEASEGDPADAAPRLNSALARVSLSASATPASSSLPISASDRGQVAVTSIELGSGVNWTEL